MKYVFKIAIKGKVHSFASESYSSIFSQVSQTLKENNINFTEKEIRAQIERQSSLSTKKKSKVSLLDAFNGARALINYTAGNSASPQEIYRRAEICRGCPVLDQTSGCAACGAARNAANLVNMIRAHKKSEVAIPSDLKDKYCGSCSCSISLLIVTKYKDFHKESDEKNARRPDVCWIKRASKNFTEE